MKSRLNTLHLRTGFYTTLTNTIVFAFFTVNEVDEHGAQSR